MSDDKKEVWLDLIGGSTLLPPDTSNLELLSPDVKAELSDKDKELYHHFRPIRLHLLKKRNRWMLSSLDQLFVLANKK